MQLEVIWDMETGDPDDFFTLLLLLGHPQVHLKAVTVLPGAPDQIGLVRAALNWFQVDLPVGAHNLHHEKPCVSEWYYDTYGDFPPSHAAVPAAELLHALCNEHTTLITGAALKNLAHTLKLYPDFRLGRLVAQGGFAGDNLVPPEKQLPQFKGHLTSPTTNLNKDPKAAFQVLAAPHIDVRRFVSKNVCHGVYYDRALHDQVRILKPHSQSLALIWQGMEAYFNLDPAGKKFHDPLAACCAIDETIATWAEVELYREKGAWGAKSAPGSNTWITVGYDRESFIRTLLGGLLL